MYKLYYDFLEEITKDVISLFKRKLEYWEKTPTNLKSTVNILTDLESDLNPRPSAMVRIAVATP